MVIGHDLHAADVVYHKACYTKKHTDYRSSIRSEAKQPESITPTTIAIKHVINHITQVHEESGYSVFELEAMYDTFTQELGASSDNGINRTRFKE